MEFGTPRGEIGWFGLSLYHEELSRVAVDGGR